MTNEMAEVIFAAWAARVEAGDALEFDDLLREQAEHTAELRKLHEDWKLFAPLLGKVVPGLIGSDGDIVVKPLSSGGDDDDAMPTDELVDRLGIKAPNSGRYRFRAVIGRGGGGVVLKVWDTKLCRPLAMKVVLGRGEGGRPTGDTPKVDGRTLTRFVDEARIASQLNHPGIVPVHELGADETGRAFFTMKLVRGEDLSVVFEHVKTGKDDWNQTRALNVLQRVCEAMAFAHDKGVVHRDLKPANIMVGRYGEVYVMDWGLARVLGEKDHVDLRVKPPFDANASVVDSVRAAERGAEHESPLLTMGGQALGTPAYMSPEQARGDVEAIGVRSDVYAIGAMLYELVAGRMPYEDPAVPAGALAIMELVKRGPPEPLTNFAPRAPAELIAIAEKAMERDAARRYPNMQNLEADLRAFLVGHVVKAYETGTWAETKKLVRRNKALAGALAAIVTITSAAGTVFIWLSGELSVKTARTQRLGDERDQALAAASNLRSIADQRRQEAELLKATAQHDADLAQWRLIIATGRVAFPEDPEMRAMLLREISVSLRDQYSEDLSVASVVGRYHRICTLYGHSGAVLSANWSPNGRRVVTASADGTARIWNADGTGDPIVLRSHGAEVTWAEWSPDGGRVVTASNDMTACVWQANGSSMPVVLFGHAGEVHCAKWSPDGRHIVTAASDGRACVWNADGTGEPLFLDGHGGDVHTADWSPDGRRILTASDDGTARIWDISGAGVPPITLVGHSGVVNSAAWSPDGTRIVTASQDGTARLWCADGTPSGIVLRAVDEYARDEGPIRAAVWSSDGERIVVTASGGQVHVWNVDGSSGPVVKPFLADLGVTGSPFEGWVSSHVSQTFDADSVALSHDGGWIVATSGDTTTRVWRAMAEDSTTGVVLRGHGARVNTAAWSPDDRRIVTASSDGTARIWALQETVEPAHLDNGNVLAWSPDGGRILTSSFEGKLYVRSASEYGRAIALGVDRGDVTSADWSQDGDRIATASRDGTVQVWNAASAALMAEFHGHAGAVNSVKWSPDGHSIVTSSKDSTAGVWNADTTGMLVLLKGHGGAVNHAEWSPDGKRIATASDDRTVCIWNAEGRGAPLVLSGHHDRVRTVAWSPDGTRLVSSAEDGEVYVWLASGTRSPVALGTCDTHAEPPSWSPDGQQVVTIKGIPLLWNPDGKGAPVALNVGLGKISSCAWSPDGRRIATTSWLGTLCIWNLDRTLPHIELPQMDDWIGNARWSPDGRRIVTSPNAVRVWTLDWPTLRSRLWDEIDDLLSQEERVRYLGETVAQAQATCQRQKAERDAKVIAR
jgi:WD40 repeat protein/serine/threonine protein kinase